MRALSQEASNRAGDICYGCCRGLSEQRRRSRLTSGFELFVFPAPADQALSMRQCGEKAGGEVRALGLHTWGGPCRLPHGPVTEPPSQPGPKPAHEAARPGDQGQNCRGAEILSGRFGPCPLSYLSLLLILKGSCRMHKLCLEREEFWYKVLQLEQVNTGEGEETPLHPAERWGLWGC